MVRVVDLREESLPSGGIQDLGGWKRCFYCTVILAVHVCKVLLQSETSVIALQVILDLSCVQARWCGTEGESFRQEADFCFIQCGVRQINYHTCCHLLLLRMTSCVVSVLSSGYASRV